MSISVSQSMNQNTIPKTQSYSGTELNPNEMSMFFEDILKNKEMIKQMLYTNILIYNDKVSSNAEKIKEIKDEIAKMDSDFLLVENKLKLEFAKCHDNTQKHDINFKLLDKTHSHYKSLIFEREAEIRKLSDKLLFAEQDYQNKKIKLDCLNIQITEVEFQLKNLNSKLNEQVENIIEEGDSDSIIEFKKNVVDNNLDFPNTQDYRESQKKENESKFFYKLRLFMSLLFRKIVVN